MREVKKVVILGANGTMGSGAAALFAGSGFEVAMLARGIDRAHQGLAKAKQAVRSDVLGNHIRCGSYDADLETEVAAADLIFEAVSEDMAVKGPFFERIDRARQPGSIVGTVSSGLSIGKMCAGRSDDFRRHFLGLHLFNPPHVITGTEIIAGRETHPELFTEMTALLRRRLGRTVIACRDLPAFAGNRVGFKVLNECAILAEEHGVPFIDYLVGPYTGRAMAPLATIDLVGWDVHRAIVDNVYANTRDEAHEAFALPAYMKALMAQGHQGDKTPLEGGFYRNWTEEGTKITSALLPKTREYTERQAPPVAKIAWVEEVKALSAVGRYRDAMQRFLRAEGAEADLARKVIVGYVSYGLNRVGPDEVVQSPAGVDQIMGFGFNWAPPSVLVDLWGKKETTLAMDKLGLKVPAVLSALPDGQRLYAQPSSSVGRFFYGK
jgi:3-hydroxyacyl-CoA dehydrogenase